MAYPYDDRPRGDYRSEREFDRGGRNFLERAGEEVRSWFGGDDDRGRRPHDEHEHGRGRMSSERGWAAGDRVEGPRRLRNESDRWRDDEDRWRTDSGRGDYDRWGSGPRGWDDARYPGGAGASGAPERWGRDSREREGRDDWRWRSSSESRGIYEDDGGRVHTFSHWPETNYTGRGPKGYRRSDDRIREDICDRLTEDSRIDASEMDIAVQNGEVMLSGTVRHRDDKRRAEDLVESIPGVRDVRNNLRVGLDESAANARTDTAAGNPPLGTPVNTPPTARR